MKMKTENAVKINAILQKLVTSGDLTKKDLFTHFMDLSFYLKSGGNLDLDRMTASDDTYSLLHDIFGINKHLCHDTGKLRDGFLPRFEIWEEK